MNDWTDALAAVKQKGIFLFFSIRPYMRYRTLLDLVPAWMGLSDVHSCGKQNKTRKGNLFFSIPEQRNLVTIAIADLSGLVLAWIVD